MRPLHGHFESLLASRQFRRLLVWSACAHVILLALANVRLHSNRTVVPPASVVVDLVSPPSAGARGKSAAIEPARPKPAPERVVNLPKPKPEPPKPKVVELPKPKPVPPKPVAKPEPPKPEAPPEPTKSAAEVMAELRERMASKAGSEAPEAESASASAPAGGRFDPEMAAYHDRVKALLRSNWVGERAFASDPGLKALYTVRVDAAGGILSIELVRSSGNPFFDESAERAIKKSAPWPAPPRGAFELDVEFNPGGVA